MAGAEATDNEENEDNLCESFSCHKPVRPVAGIKMHPTECQTGISMVLASPLEDMAADICQKPAPVSVQLLPDNDDKLSTNSGIPKDCDSAEGYPEDMETNVGEATLPETGNKNVPTEQGYTKLPKKELLIHFSAKVGRSKKNAKLKRIIKEKAERQAKKKKWRPLSLEEVGIYPSLFPRLQKEAKLGPNSEALSELCDREFDEIEEKLVSNGDYELYCAIGVKEVRSDRDRKIRKARKQVKDKYCVSVKNNNGKALYVHHRVFKLMDLEPQKAHYLPKPKTTCVASNLEDVKMSRAKLKASGGNREKVKGGRDVVDKPTPPAATQTRHALHSSNVPSVIASDQGLVDLLISLQHRELSPEDYELLLRLDEQVAPKTLSNKTLSSFKSDEATDADTADACAICMENYSVGDQRKYLPCDHIFHAGCIDMWLQNSSLNCPLDGLPVTQ